MIVLNRLQTESHPHDPNLSLRSQIDKEILQLESQALRIDQTSLLPISNLSDRIHSLKLKRNSLLPISSIPMEVLVEIFLLGNTGHEDGLVLSQSIYRMGGSLMLGERSRWTILCFGQR
ncbi:hypothetical protein BDN72DRAFT_304718 [Pluteus cervinus]|uniref:Uncharacterized protein n=1 Tax=Pluteus cervinus TaxID=181527 RepID=A0ACD3B3N8_9AGAR|nr:hypothetical protein BDN72DRAFT_304718 [Pluteus cervinus]